MVLSVAPQVVQPVDANAEPQRAVMSAAQEVSSTPAARGLSVGAKLGIGAGLAAALAGLVAWWRA